MLIRGITKPTINILCCKARQSSARLELGQILPYAEFTASGGSLSRQELRREDQGHSDIGGGARVGARRPQLAQPREQGRDRPAQVKGPARVVRNRGQAQDSKVITGWRARLATPDAISPAAKRRRSPKRDILSQRSSGSFDDLSVKLGWNSRFRQIEPHRA
jgi:hypothetical protein